RALGIAARPVLLGPVSFLLLGKVREEDGREGFDPLVELLDPLLAVYREVVARLAAQGAAWIQLDEPCFVQDRGPRELAALRRATSRPTGAWSAPPARCCTSRSTSTTSRSGRSTPSCAPGWPSRARSSARSPPCGAGSTRGARRSRSSWRRATASRRAAAPP